MLQTDFSWTYPSIPPQQQQQQPPQQQHLPQQHSMWAPVPPSGLGSAFRTTPLGSHTDLHHMDAGVEPTFHDDMAGIFDCDHLLFNDMTGEAWQNGTTEVVVDASDGPGVVGSCTNILDLGPTTGLAGLETTTAPLGAAAIATGVAVTMAPATGSLEPKITAEASGSGSGEASAEDFALPGAPEAQIPAGGVFGEQASAPPLKIVLGEEEEEATSEDDEETFGRSRRVTTGGLARGSSFAVARSAAQHAQQPTPLSSSGYSAGRSQPSTSRGGQASAASALGKRAGTDLEAAKKGRRRRLPSRRAAAAAFDDSSDEEYDDTQYRNARRAAGQHAGIAAAGGGGVARTSTRLQGRTTPYRIDSDYVTYEDDEPASPTRGGSGSTPRRGRGRTATVAAAAAASGGSGSGTGFVRRPPPARIGRRTVPLAAQRIRATSARHESKGRPSFAEIVEAGFMRPGPHRFNVGNVEVAAAVGEDGAILYGGTRYRAISKFALVVLRERNPTRQSCDGWKEVAWNGEKLDALRVRVQAHARQIARQRSQ